MKTSLEPLQLILALGFPLDRADIIHAFVGGSALHGVKLSGTDDTDVYGSRLRHQSCHAHAAAAL
jgi:hypothetical protein